MANAEEEAGGESIDVRVSDASSPPRVQRTLRPLPTPDLSFMTRFSDKRTTSTTPRPPSPPGKSPGSRIFTSHGTGLGSYDATPARELFRRPADQPVAAPAAATVATPSDASMGSAVSRPTPRSVDTDMPTVSSGRRRRLSSGSSDSSAPSRTLARRGAPSLTLDVAAAQQQKQRDLRQQQHQQHQQQYQQHGMGALQGLTSPPLTPVETPPLGVSVVTSRMRTAPMHAFGMSYATPLAALSKFEREFDDLGLLGSGSFGDVHKVRGLADEQLYAIKRTKKAFRGMRDRARVIREVTNIMSLGLHVTAHTHVLRYYGAWEEAGFLYIQTEWCEQGSLSQVLAKKEHPIPESFVWQVLCDVALGLRHIHASGLLHMDIKPDNLFVTAEDVVKIGDFGLAVRRGCWEDGGEGDACYLAPELLRSVAQPDTAADIFSLGVSVFDMASEVSLPNSGPLWHQLRQRGGARLPAHYSPALQDLVTRMMDPEPARRPTCELILQHPRLQEFLAARSDAGDSLLSPPAAATAIRTLSPQSGSSSSSSMMFSVPSPVSPATANSAALAALSPYPSIGHGFPTPGHALMPPPTPANGAAFAVSPLHQQHQQPQQHRRAGSPIAVPPLRRGSMPTPQQQQQRCASPMWSPTSPVATSPAFTGARFPLGPLPPALSAGFRPISSPAQQQQQQQQQQQTGFAPIRSPSQQGSLLPSPFHHPQQQQQLYRQHRQAFSPPAQSPGVFSPVSRIRAGSPLPDLGTSPMNSPAMSESVMFRRSHLGSVAALHMPPPASPAPPQPAQYHRVATISATPMRAFANRSCGSVAGHDAGRHVLSVAPTPPPHAAAAATAAGNEPGLDEGVKEAAPVASASSTNLMLRFEQAAEPLETSVSSDSLPRRTPGSSSTSAASTVSVSSCDDGNTSSDMLID